MEEFLIVKTFNMVLMIVVLGMVGGIAGVTVALVKESKKTVANVEQ